MTADLLTTSAEEYWVGVVMATTNKGAGDHFGNIVCECWSYVAERPNVAETWFGNVRVEGEIFIKYDAEDLDAVGQRDRRSSDVNGVEH